LKSTKIEPPQISILVSGLPMRVIGLLIYREWTLIFYGGNSITSPLFALSINFWMCLPSSSTKDKSLYLSFKSYKFSLLSPCLTILIKLFIVWSTPVKFSLNVRSEN